MAIYSGKHLTHGSVRAKKLSSVYSEDLPEAILVANQLKSVYNAHIADTDQHTTAADETNDIEAADASTLATLITLVTELLTDYDAHDDDAELGSGWSYHAAQEAADHSPASTTAPTDLEECWVDLKDLLLKFNAHTSDDTAHGEAGTESQLSKSIDVSFGKSSFYNIEINEATALTINLTDAYDGAELLIKIDSPSVDDTLTVQIGSTACTAQASSSFTAGDVNYLRIFVIDAINDVSVVEYLVS